MIVDVHTHIPHGHAPSPGQRAAARPDRADLGVVTADDYLRVESLPWGNE